MQQGGRYLKTIGGSINFPFIDEETEALPGKGLPDITQNRMELECKPRPEA